MSTVKALRFLAVLGVLWAIFNVFSPDNTAWEWFMTDESTPTSLAGAMSLVDEWHSALLNTRLIAVAIFIGASMLGAWTHAQIEMRGF